MKSIKKRFKQLLAEIEQSASELAVLSADLELLSEIRRMANQVSKACEALRLETSKLKKANFSEGIADAETLAQLDEIVDIDAISALEDRFFAELQNQADSDIGEFLQQLLDKIDKCYTKMVENIQQLSALLEEE
ncbi:MAG: hypothetical protein LUQ11_13415 [Methylococcaceae bacterium]|nr:hypothetical protein [Methylococcaceae bacterium]